MLGQADAYLGRMWPVKYSGLDWSVEGRESSLFGTIKVLKSSPIDSQGRFLRVYFQDGLFQNQMLSAMFLLNACAYSLLVNGLASRHNLFW